MALKKLETQLAHEFNAKSQHCYSNELIAALEKFDGAKIKKAADKERAIAFIKEQLEKVKDFNQYQAQVADFSYNPSRHQILL
jgi:hypothetical protein